MSKIKNIARSSIVGVTMLVAMNSATAALIDFSIDGLVDSADAGNIFNVSVGSTITATGSFDDSLLTGGQGLVTDLIITVGDLTFDNSMDAFGGGAITLTAGGAFDNLLYEANEGLLGSAAFFDSLSFARFTGSAFNGPRVQGQFTELAIAGTWDQSTFTVVPVPAALWLFGSGLLGLVGFTRRKNRKII